MPQRHRRATQHHRVALQPEQPLLQRLGGVALGVTLEHEVLQLVRLVLQSLHGGEVAIDHLVEQRVEGETRLVHLGVPVPPCLHPVHRGYSGAHRSVTMKSAAGDHVDLVFLQRLDRRLRADVIGRSTMYA